MDQNKILIKLLAPVKKSGVLEVCLHSGMHYNLLTIPDFFLVSQGVHLFFVVHKVPWILTQNLARKNVFKSGNFMGKWKIFMMWIDQWWMGLNIKLKLYFLFTKSICGINITRSLLSSFIIYTVHCAELLRI